MVGIFKGANIKVYFLFIIKVNPVKGSRFVAQFQRYHVVKRDSDSLYKDVQYFSMFSRHVWKAVQAVASNYSFKDVLAIGRTF